MNRVFVYSILVIFMIITQSQAAIHNIDIGNFFFSPAKTTVQPGDTVRWTNTAGFHTSTSENNSPKQWDSGTLSSGQSFEVIFNESDGTGPFPYLCTIHPLSMKDTIFVNIPGGCCDMPGDATNDNTVGISDLTFFVDYMFNGGPPPVCEDEFDNNADCTLGISDLTYFVDFMFSGGTSPVCGCVVN